jgi:16S rRNA (guanine966-N2)-methyltransferase
LFDALSDCFAVDEGNGAGTVLDCFSGTGSMGLECLSRGAAKAIFVEQDRGALRALRQNISDLGVEARAVVLPVDAYLCATHPEVRGGGGLTVAFVDPPYAHVATGHLRDKVDQLLRALAAGCMVDGGIISLRHPGNISVDAAMLGVRVVREFRYGDMGITWLTKA